MVFLPAAMTGVNDSKRLSGWCFHYLSLTLAFIFGDIVKNRYWDRVCVAQTLQSRDVQADVLGRLDHAQILEIIFGDKRNGFSLSVCAPSSADAMDIFIGRKRQIIIDNASQSLNINSSCSTPVAIMYLTFPALKSAKGEVRIADFDRYEKLLPVSLAFRAVGPV